MGPKGKLEVVSIPLKSFGCLEVVQLETESSHRRATYFRQHTLYTKEDCALEQKLKIRQKQMLQFYFQTLYCYLIN